MAEGLELDLRQAVALNVAWIQAFGYFCPRFNNFNKRLAYYVYALICMGFFYILYIASEFINMVLVFGNIEKMTEASFLFLTHLIQVTKLYVLIVHNARVHTLINSINQQEFQPKDHSQLAILQNGINFSKKITKTFLFMGFLTCLLWAIFPFLDRRADAGNVKLPLSGWFPFDIRKSPVFECVFIYQTIGACVNAFGNISIDTFLSGCIMVVAGQLKILNQSLKITQKNNQNFFQQHVNHHKKIIRFALTFTELFTNCIMAQFVVSVIIICITMFQMSIVPVISLQFVSMTLYQSCMLLEIFLWCYFGNEVILESGQLTLSAYMGEWIDNSNDLNKNILFFMTRTKIPLKLYAGGYFTLSLETFMAILKSSWSYFAVLNRVRSEENI